MNDIFYIGAYWVDRAQKIGEIIMPTLNVLKGLSVIDNQFQYYYELGMSRKEALKNQVNITQSDIHHLLLKDVKKNDLDWEGYNKTGYSIRLWNGQNDYEASSISFNLGCSSPRISNNCVIKFPSEGETKKRLLELIKVRQIIDLMVENFHPDILVLNSRRLQTALNIANEVGWVTYKKHVGEKVKVSNFITHESNYKGGHLFYLNTGGELAYDYEMIDELKFLKDSLFLDVSQK